MENIIHPFFTVDNIAQCQEDSVMDHDSDMLTLKGFFYHWAILLYL
jgi:hypothetical protein